MAELTEEQKRLLREKQSQGGFGAAPSGTFDPVAPVIVPEPAAIAPEPVVINEVVKDRGAFSIGQEANFGVGGEGGEAAVPLMDVTTKSRKETKEFQKIQSELDANVAAGQEIVGRQAEVERAGFDRQIAIEEKAVADKAARAQEDAIAIDEQNRQIAERSSAVEKQTAEFAAMKPTTYWSRQDTGNKIGMGIAVFLGAVAQGLGAKENMALQVIENAVERDLALQKSAVNQKLKSIDNSNISLQNKKAQKNKLLDQFEARERASYDQVQSQLKVAALRTNSELTKGKADQAIVALNQAKLEKAQEYQGRLTTEITTDRVLIDEGQGDATAHDVVATSSEGATNAVIKAARPGVRRPSSTKEMNEFKSRAAGYVLLNQDNSKLAEGIEENLTPEEFTSLMRATEEIQLRAQAAETTGGDILIMIAETKENLRQHFEAALPGTATKSRGGAYFQALWEMAHDQARVVSGAAVTAQEIAQELAKYMPMLGSKQGDIGTFVKRRRNSLINHRNVSGSRKLLWFEGPEEAKK